LDNKAIRNATIPAAQFCYFLGDFSISNVQIRLVLALHFIAMTKRNSPLDIQSLDDLTRIDEIVVDKRQGKRANAKRSRRNRHYGKQFIKNSLSLALVAPADAPESDADDTV
jgi:hypothetical protein